ncbi:hypothetical protein K505DRAFT_107243 [Melanomma pulvis-pyrius CBS 109.77]|uniref:Uncharacterized protein n=1 Tax=Melanomma pulvis-pyrius CBS 109.77 TaxID=1314802 RepID=A0A6A6XPG8_9PLEO|nr:hypothetical protein K505DRAFT_107243 [Melanomma pulvis-pyrius CBS 109.77]
MAPVSDLACPPALRLPSRQPLPTSTGVRLGARVGASRSASRVMVSLRRDTVTARTAPQFQESGYPRPADVLSRTGDSQRLWIVAPSYGVWGVAARHVHRAWGLTVSFHRSSCALARPCMTGVGLSSLLSTTSSSRRTQMPPVITVNRSDSRRRGRSLMSLSPMTVH